VADSRPAPQYGEYATPEEVAALRGVPDASAPERSEPGPSPVAPSDGRSRARRWDRPITVALIAFGVLNLVQYFSAYVDFEGFLEVATKGTAAESIDFTEAARIGGLVLFLVCLVIVVGSTAVAVLLLRRGRLAFWVPLVAGVLTVLAWFVAILVIVLQTPGALPLTGS
jgi:hypothetical protein